jgi:hypothetical protein
LNEAVVVKFEISPEGLRKTTKDFKITGPFYRDLYPEHPEYKGKGLNFLTR